jgi:toxin ParE1/3/4
VTRKVIYSPEAAADLDSLYDFIADQGGPIRAINYIERIAEFCNRLSDFPERGTRHDHLRAGLRTVGFERRVAIAFHVLNDTVIIDRILYGGRDIATNLKG